MKVGRHPFSGRDGDTSHPLRLVLSLLLLILSLAVVALSYLKTGLSAQPHFAYVIVPVLLSGLLLGRAALWCTAILCLGILLAAFALEAGANGSGFDPASSLLTLLLQSSIICIVVTLVMDRLLLKSMRSEQRKAQATSLLSQLHHEISEKEKSRRQLTHAMKMDAIGRLSSSIAHEFGNYLSVISGHAEQALASGSTVESDHHVSAIVDATLRASRLSQKLLAVSRPAALHQSVFDASIAISELMPLIRPIFDKALVIDLELPDEACLVRMDRDEFDLVILNAARNSSQAITGPGTFRIRLSASEDDVRIDIIDDGHGIPADILDNVFEPFFTTKDSGEGTGLGLSTAYRSVADAGGEMVMDSAPGRGTCLTVRLPRVASHTSSNDPRMQVRSGDPDITPPEASASRPG